MEEKKTIFIHSFIHHLACSILNFPFRRCCCWSYLFHCYLHIQYMHTHVTCGGDDPLLYDDSLPVPFPLSLNKATLSPRGLGGRYPYEPEPENNPVPTERRIHNNLFSVTSYNNLCAPPIPDGYSLAYPRQFSHSPHKQKTKISLHCTLHSISTVTPHPDDFHPISGPMIDPGTWNIMKQTNRQTDKQTETNQPFANGIRSVGTRSAICAASRQTGRSINRQPDSLEEEGAIDVLW